MGGGLMNIISQGNENVLFNGNPKKTFFKATYNKFTNFGLQKFRIDYEGSKVLSETTPTTYTFKVPRYADMLHDTHLVMNLPNIYSPFYYSTGSINNVIPYEFQWIKELGGNLINEVEIKAGGVTLAKYDGEYLICMKERDFSKAKKGLWDRMTGNIKELNDPANSNGNINVYPNVSFTNEGVNIEPSIRGRKIYIPLSCFFCNNSKMSLPLVALQYQEIHIKIELKPIIDLFTINNVDALNVSGSENTSGISYRIRSNPNILHHQIWNFLQAPTNINAQLSNYVKRSEWNADVHLMSTYVFLSKAEVRYFAAQEHNYFIKQVYSYNNYNASGSKVVKVESKDMVSNYMWRFRRNDVKLRNEWSNYTNWAYDNIKPQNLKLYEHPDYSNPNRFYITGNIGVPNNTPTQYPVNLKEILVNFGIVINGVYRENVFDSGVYNYIEKMNRTPSDAKEGLYCYNFCLDTNYKVYQPSGAMNMNRFNNIAFEYETIETPFDASGVNVDFICDDNQNMIGFRNTSINLTQYDFDLKIYEERFNVVNIQGGRIGLINAR